MEKQKKAEELLEDKTAEPDEAEPYTDIKTETQVEPEETQNAEITPEPEEPKKKGGILRFRKKKSPEKSTLKTEHVILAYPVALIHFKVVGVSS